MESNNKFKATVIGAGPAGIATVACLLQYGMGPVLWIDPEFNVGKITSYYNVPGNTMARLYVNWWKELPVIRDNVPSFPKHFDHYNENETQPLLFIGNALKEVVQYLLQRDDVVKHKGMAEKIEVKGDKHIINDKFESEYCFICTGCYPNTLDLHYPDQQVIDLIHVLNDNYRDYEKGDHYAVFGSSHSSLLAAMTLSKYTKNITLFYKHDVLYAVYHKDWIEFDDTGLKGRVAEWTKANLEKLHRVQVDLPIFKEELRKCNKVIYGTGLNKNPLPQLIINGKNISNDNLSYDLSTGKIYNKLYGFGVAFPKENVDRRGKKEFSVGIWKFMKHIHEVVRNLYAKGKDSPVLPTPKL
jgi:thioredoxin reductase